MPEGLCEWTRRSWTTQTLKRILERVEARTGRNADKLSNKPVLRLGKLKPR